VLSTTNPYFTPDGISRTFDLYYKTTRPYERTGRRLRDRHPGVGVRFGVPFTEPTRCSSASGPSDRRSPKANQLPEAYKDQARHLHSADHRLGARQPRQRAGAHEGRLQRFNTELGISGDIALRQADYQFQQYMPLTRQYTLAFNTELGGQGAGWQAVPGASRTSTAVAWARCAASSKAPSAPPPR
jgi:outer membrane protein insertion porin family